MARQASQQPTEVELAILNVLWERGQATARQIHELVGVQRETNYSTTVKMLSIMLEKELVKRDDSVRPQLFQAAYSRKRTGTKMLRDMVEKVFDGSATALAMQALALKRASSAEIAEMRAMLDKLEEQNDDDV